jgi:hypothetical protein
MALGIGVAGTMAPVFREGIQVGIDALPTLAVVLLGGIAGGYFAVQMEKVNSEA